MQGERKKAAVHPENVQDEAQLQKELDNKAQELLEERSGFPDADLYFDPMSKILVVLLCVWTVFQLYFTTLGAISAINLRAFHCIFLLLFTFLLFPAYKREACAEGAAVLGYPSDFAEAGSFGYLIMNFTRIAETGGRVDSFEVGIAAVALLVVFEAARRASGNLALLALIFLGYNWFGAFLPGLLGHNGFTLKRVLITQFWGTQGVLGTGIPACRPRTFFSLLCSARS